MENRSQCGENLMEEQPEVKDANCSASMSVGERRGGGGQRTIRAHRKCVMGSGNCQESRRNKRLSPASLLCSDHAATTAL